MSGITVPHIVVIDPGVRTPEIDTYNHLCGMNKLPLTYHLPAMFGFESLPRDTSLVRGVIVLGSLASVYDPFEWQSTLAAWLRTLCDKGVPFLGICYGHQLLAHMYGARIEYAKPDHAKLRGVRHIDIDIKQLAIKGSKRLIVTHNEVVTSVPDDFEIIASSTEVAIEGLKHKNKPIFSLQSHPEATQEFLRSREMLDAQALNALQDGHEIMRAFIDFVAAR